MIIIFFFFVFALTYVHRIGLTQPLSSSDRGKGS